jgi:rieske iron-sulfur protein
MTKPLSNRQQADTPGSVVARPSGGPEGPRPRRRAVLGWMIGLAAGAFAVTFSVPALALKALTLGRPVIAPGDVLVYADGTTGAAAGQPFHANDLAPGASAQLFPMGKTENQDNLLQVVRISPGRGVDGLVAFSAICTHLGCAVFEKLTQDGLIACPCHGSHFDPARKAAVQRGPAERPLPSLPIAAGPNGTVVANGPFSGAIGPQ